MTTSEEKLVEFVAQFAQEGKAIRAEIGAAATEARRKVVAEHMARFAEGDEELARLLAMSVGRVMLKALNNRRNEPADDQTMRHIADWLAAAIATGASWLKNVDTHGRPKKLMKFGTVAQITAEADKAMGVANSKTRLQAEGDADEQVYMDLTDGYSLVRLLEPAALDRESSAMQHCIGNGAYDFNLKSGRRMYLSLRDPSGNPHATLEIDLEGARLIQLQGKQNRAPVRRYFEIMRPYLEKSGLALNIPASRLGFVVDKNGEWHSIDELPDGLEIDGNLDISGSDLANLPRGLAVSGNLIANDTLLDQLPDGLSVGGDIHLARSHIRRLGNVTRVNGDLVLNRSRIMFLPDGLQVQGSMDVSGSKLWRLPGGLSVRHSLDISDTDIEALPEDIFIGVKLEMYRTELKSLPDCLDDDLVVYHGRRAGRGGRDGCLAGEMKAPKPQQPSLLKRLIGRG